MKPLNKGDRGDLTLLSEFEYFRFLRGIQVKRNETG